MLHYKFDPKIQAIYGIFGFLTTLAILFLILGRIELITALAIGIGNFLIAGFYTDTIEMSDLLVAERRIQV